PLSSDTRAAGTSVQPTTGAVSELVSGAGSAGGSGPVSGLMQGAASLASQAIGSLPRATSPSPGGAPGSLARLPLPFGGRGAGPRPPAGPSGAPQGAPPLPWGGALSGGREPAISPRPSVPGSNGPQAAWPWGGHLAQGLLAALSALDAAGAFLAKASGSEPRAA